MPPIIDLEGLGALLSIVVIDVVLAGDNAIVVGMAAAGLPNVLRRRVIVVGIAIATVLRIALSLVAQQLLAIIGLTLAGGVLLLGVSWKLYRELRPARRHRDAPRRGGESGEARPPVKTFGQALFQVVAADVSMSLDNVLAIAGTARGHFWLLALGLLLSVALMGLASHLIARLLARYHWIGWVGLTMITVVALRMIYDGSAEVIAHVSGTGLL